MLLGINQGLTWSTTIVMKIDLVGPHRRGLAMGFNEAAGYLAVAVTAVATGWLAAAYGLRPAPFLLGLAFAAVGFGLSTIFVRETHHHARHEARSYTPQRRASRRDSRRRHPGARLVSTAVDHDGSTRTVPARASSPYGGRQAMLCRGGLPRLLRY